jgi:hypothetical protein
MMTLLLKDPEAVLNYAVDWGAEYLGADSLIASRWEISPVEQGGVNIDWASFDANAATVTASGGISGHSYDLRNHVILASGLTDSRSITMRLEKR